MAEIFQNPHLLAHQDADTIDVFYIFFMETMVSLGTIIEQTNPYLSKQMLEIFNTDNISNFIREIFPVICYYTNIKTNICNVGDLYLNEHIFLKTLVIKYSFQ